MSLIHCFGFMPVEPLSTLPEMWITVYPFHSRGMWTNPKLRDKCKESLRGYCEAAQYNQNNFVISSDNVKCDMMLTMEHIIG